MHRPPLLVAVDHQPNQAPPNHCCCPEFQAVASELGDGYETPGAAVEALLQRKAKGKKVPPKVQHEELRRSPSKVEKGKKAAKQAEETEKALRAEVALMRRQQKEHRMHREISPQVRGKELQWGSRCWITSQGRPTLCGQPRALSS